MSETENEAIAYHESGHAVVAMALGYRCACVFIVCDEKGKRGGAICDDPQETARGTGEQRYEDRVTILLAADVAEFKRFPGGQDRAGGDRADICTAVIKYLGSETPLEKIDAERQRVVQKQMPAAKDLVERNWNDIERLARRLAVERHVTLP